MKSSHFISRMMKHFHQSSNTFKWINNDYGTLNGTIKYWDYITQYAIEVMRNDLVTFCHMISNDGYQMTLAGKRLKKTKNDGKHLSADVKLPVNWNVIERVNDHKYLRNSKKWKRIYYVKIIVVLVITGVLGTF